MFTANDYKIISDIVFTEKYPGYRPNVVESPNGDGNWDNEKRYAHVATKYLEQYTKKLSLSDANADHIILDAYLNNGHQFAVKVAIELGVPKAFWPDKRYSALRILEYPPGSITHVHTDFDLFTLMCYRNIPLNFQYVSDYDIALVKANLLNDQIHFGEILELILPKYFQATEHKVCADHYDRTQYSIVYFAIPDHSATLPSGETVGKWIDERISRSRKEVS